MRGLFIATIPCILILAICVASARPLPERRYPVGDDRMPGGNPTACPVPQCDIIDLYYAGSLSRLFYYRHLAAASAPGSTVPSCAGRFHAVVAWIDEWAPVAVLIALLVPIYAALHIAWSWINRIADNWYAPYSNVRLLGCITLGVRMLWRFAGLITLNVTGGEPTRTKKKKTM